MSATTERQRRDVVKWQKQLNADRASLLKTPAFCRVMHDLLTLTGVWRISFAGESTHATAFAEGMRNAGLRLLSDLETADPTALALLKTHAMPVSTALEIPDE